MTFSVTILGSSSALPTSQRFPAAHALNVHERLFLIDCGEGTQMQLRKYKQKLSRIEQIFISHLHGDHTLGLVGLISTLNLLGRKSALTIHAHAELQPLLDQNLKFFVNDLQFKIDFKALDHKKKKIIFEDKSIEIESFPLKHRIPCCGFIFREKPKLPNIKKDLIEKHQIPLAEIIRIKNGADFYTQDGNKIPNEVLTYHSFVPRSYAYCTDTIYLERIADIIKGVNLLYHESTFGNDNAKMAKLTGHSTAAQAATIAKKAGVNKLLIGHFSSRYKSTQILLDEAKTIFSNSFAVEDGMEFKIEENKTNP